MVILVPGGMQLSRSGFFFEEKRALEVAEAIEVTEALEVNEAVKVSKAMKITTEVFRVLGFNDSMKNFTLF